MARKSELLNSTASANPFPDRIGIHFPQGISMTDLMKPGFAEKLVKAELRRQGMPEDYIARVKVRE